MRGNKFGQVAAGGGFNLVLQEWRPAQQQPRCPQSLAAPAPEAKVVYVAGDLAILELELSLNDVMHLPSGGGEGVPRFPVGASLAIVCLYIGEGDAQIFAALAKHMPHSARLETTQVENGIGKVDVRGVVGDHAGIIPQPKAGVKIGDDYFVGVHRLLLP